VIWLTWRQHRMQALAGLIGLAAISAFLLLTGPRISSAFRSVQACLAVPTRDCSLLDDAFHRRFDSLQFVIPVFMLVPALVGLFWGAPLVAREVEQGTHRLAWTQSVTRRRWAGTKLALIFTSTLVGAVVFAWLVTAWSAPLVASSDSRFGYGVFDLRGIVPVAYVLFALALGVAVGALIRRTLPAMAVTLGVFVAVRVAIELFLRKHYLPARTISYAFLQQSPRYGLGDWLISSRVVDPTGQFISPDGGIRVAPGTLAHACPDIFRTASFPGKDDVGRCLTRLGVRFVDTYQPGSRFWLFQGIESAIFLTLAAGLVVLTIWLIRRRIS
jgi:hypothetical protein